ncbi:hypothetical protein BV360_05109 [Pseudomonas syringae pv. actinidiae]|uniref:Prophage antirepressor n=1 Tax=Pseudomonas syringae pv. actinidiae TaxID=103796 RepID=A0AAN4Q9M7_PSESF|nr:hypothetical protein BV340_05018 [Pseudomonas syringae pv. actinidiae]OSN13693.1 hypothetical protein BV339_04951 [Pseudomonas syringae pv. actinidiae]OSN17058.1 hypothetical protein BV341_05077 [Pseudomonas syringae pv. actinidiae]OSN30191.1 hypothetical protein BV342_05146 [Pseudomonas syringae pv. actinidiae]OSN32197.1 hypothetical protein BV343_03780 [Pseudomonas syringae pv. actinidiae]
MFTVTPACQARRISTPLCFCVTVACCAPFLLTPRRGSVWPTLPRLMGKVLDQRATLKLDADQRREVWLQANGECQRQLMISESGTLALLVHHYVPENRALRQWLTYEVLTVLHDQQNVTLDNPRMTQLQWPGTSLSVLHWRSETWIRLRDMPNVVTEAAPRPQRALWRSVLKRINLKRSGA